MGGSQVNCFNPVKALGANGHAGGDTGDNHQPMGHIDCPENCSKGELKEIKGLMLKDTNSIETCKHPNQGKAACQEGEGQ